jgi:hypothetical protein
MKVKGGTPVGTASLCRTCSHAQIVSGYRESEMLVVCTSTYPDFVVPFVVRECTAWNDKAKPDWDQMKKLAIHVTPAIRSGKKVGFGGQKTARVEAANDTVDEEDLDVVAD